VISYLEGALVSRQRARERRLRQEQRGTADPSPAESGAMEPTMSEEPNEPDYDRAASGADTPMGE
jgi:hypothetical protein